MGKLILIYCEPVESDRSAWCRVHTVRLENGTSRHRINELSWPCAYRIVPKMLRNNGAIEPDRLDGHHVEHAYNAPGLWHRTVIMPILGKGGAA